MPIIAAKDEPLLVFTAMHAYSVRPNPDMNMGLVEQIELQAVLQLQEVVQVSLKLATPVEHSWCQMTSTGGSPCWAGISIAVILTSIAVREPIKAGGLCR